MLRDLLSQQRELAELMSSISERLYWAGWVDGLEFKLWRAAFEECTELGLTQITNEEVRQLQALSAHCGGWIVFDGELGEAFVPLSEWQVMLQNLPAIIQNPSVGD